MKENSFMLGNGLSCLEFSRYHTTASRRFIIIGMVSDAGSALVGGWPLLRRVGLSRVLRRTPISRFGRLRLLQLVADRRDRHADRASEGAERARSRARAPPRSNRFAAAAQGAGAGQRPRRRKRPPGWDLCAGCRRQRARSDAFGGPCRSAADRL